MNSTDTIATDMSRASASPTQSPAGIGDRYFNLYRLAAYVLALYTLGHTLGAVVITPKFGPESNTVVSLMKSVHVDAQGTSCTWYGFYTGFGWFVSVFFILSVAVSWHLGGERNGERATLMPVAFALLLSHAAGTLIAWQYFFLAPRIFSSATTLLLGFACVRDGTRCWSARSSW